MNRFAIVLTMLLVALPAWASSALSFEGDAYWIELEIGDARMPAIASVRFHAPGDARGVVLPADDWRVVRFDEARRVLVLRHAGGRTAVAPFELSVHDDQARLSIDGREIRSSFRWER